MCSLRRYGAVVTGLIPQRPNYRFHNHVLFENVQATSADGNPTATDDSALYMLHMAYTESIYLQVLVSRLRLVISKRRIFRQTYLLLNAQRTTIRMLLQLKKSAKFEK